jgi:hypothetical protein
VRSAVVTAAITDALRRPLLQPEPTRGPRAGLLVRIEAKEGREDDVEQFSPTRPGVRGPHGARSTYVDSFTSATELKAIGGVGRKLTGVAEKYVS